MLPPPTCWLLCNLVVNRVQKILIKCIQKISLTHTEIKAHPSTGTATNARPNTALSSCFYYSQLLPTAYGGKCYYCYYVMYKRSKIMTSSLHLHQRFNPIHNYQPKRLSSWHFLLLMLSQQDGPNSQEIIQTIPKHSTTKQPEAFRFLNPVLEHTHTFLEQIQKAGTLRTKTTKTPEQPSCSLSTLQGSLQKSRLVNSKNLSTTHAQV